MCTTGAVCDDQNDLDLSKEGQETDLNTRN